MRSFFLCIFFLGLSAAATVSAQYTVNLNATRDNCNCYTLTRDFLHQSGSVWNNNKINLTQSFNFTFDVFLGYKDVGADGIAFVLQPISTSVGSTGGGMGYVGITPAVGVTLDTYSNFQDSDPSYDHIAIQLNGNVNHGSPNTITPLTAISASSDNVEDGQVHFLRVAWDAPTKNLRVFFDAVQRLNVTNDFVTTVFGGDPLVFWGFTGATGGLSNEQGFCTSLQPKFFFGPGQQTCVGVPIIFNDSTVTFGGIIKKYWDFGDGSPIDSVSNSPTHTYSTAGVYNVKLSVLAADSCSAVFNSSVTVGTKPVAAFNFNDNCILNTMSFTDSSYATVGTINNRNWDFGNGQTGTGTSPTTTYATPGNKLVKLVATSLQGCVSDTLVKTIRIVGRPVVDFSFTDSVCLGTAISFTGNVKSSTDPVTGYRWDFGNGNLASSKDTSFTFSSPGTHTVSFSATSNVSGACYGTVTKTVFIADKPIASFKQPGICQGASVVFTDSSYSSDGTVVNSWWWNLGNGNTSMNQNPATSFAVAGTTNISLVVRSANGCVSDTVVRSVAINPKPVAAFLIKGSLCAGMPANLMDSSKIASGVINSYTWINNNAVVSTAQNPFFVLPAGNQLISLVVRSASGCSSDTFRRSVVILPRPQIAMSFNDACKNTSINFLGSKTNNNLVSSWQWFFGDGSGAATQTATHAYTNNGSYPVQLFAVDNNGCISDTLKRNITIYGTNAFAGDDVIAASGQPVQLQASGGLSYEWAPATGLSNAAIANPVATNTTDRQYILKAFTPEGCESYDTLQVKIYKGPDIYVPGAFTPNNDGLNDLFRAIPVGINQFEFLAVYDRYGQLIFKTSNSQEGWDGTINGAAQQTGTYVWMAAGTDFNGKRIVKKGSVVLLR